MLRLRPYKKCDAAHICSWIKDERTFRRWSADRFDHYPVTAEDINAYYEAAADSDSFFQMTIFDETGAVGHLFMRFMDEEKQVLRFGFVIVDDTKRGKGYGREMIALALKYAFEILKVRKVTIGVLRTMRRHTIVINPLVFRMLPEKNRRSIISWARTGSVWNWRLRYSPGSEKRMSFPIISTGIFPDFMYSKKGNMKTNSNL